MRKSALAVEADRQATIFFGTASDVAKAFDANRIVDETVRAADPKFHKLNRLRQALNRNPFILLAGLANAWLLASEINRLPKQVQSKTASTPRKPRTARITQEGEGHGHNRESK